VPARVVGTPDWLVTLDPASRLNNHNWVEYWSDGSWSFLGSAEPDPRGPNRTWFFPSPAKSAVPGGAHAIYAASFARADANGAELRPFPLAWAPADDSVPGIDVTQSYLDAAVLSTGIGGGDAGGAPNRAGGSGGGAGDIGSSKAGSSGGGI
jgi:hypothetical protein